MVSVIIPARNEIFLNRTIQDLLEKARGDVEIIAVLDGYWPTETVRERWTTPAIVEDKRVRYLHFGTSRGMRAAINAGASIARGEYLMKCDGHCLFDEGYDVKLAADCADNWVVIPSRYSLDAENWAIERNGKMRRDYHYLCFPDPSKDHDSGMHGVEWWDRCKERLDPKFDIDETPSFQGSCWFMSKKHWVFLGGMKEEGYGTFSQEPQEIGMKTWLSGGAVMTNKKTFYCHLHKGKTYGRMYHQDSAEIVAAHAWSAHHWVFNEEPNMKYKFEWFIDEKFSGMPTWPSDWKEKLYGA